MSRVVRFRGLQAGPMPPWGHRDTSSKLGRSPQPAIGTNPAQQARLMASLGIHQEGRYYHFRSDRYVRLQDAVAHARQVDTRVPRSLPRERNRVPSRRAGEQTTAATEPDSALMKMLGVSLESGCYVCDGLRFERLADAVAHAGLRHLRET